MAWVRLADDFADHPKIVAAGPLASWLWTCGLAYANRYLTDGFIPKAQVRRLADVEDAYGLAARLVDVGLWERVEDGFQIHDYHGYQPSSESVKEERQKNADRVAAWRERQKVAGGNAQSNGVTDDFRNDFRTGAPDPVPVPLKTPVPAGENLPPSPPPQAEGGAAPKRERRRRGLLPDEVTEPLTARDEQLWLSAVEKAGQFVTPVLFDDLMKPLVPIGRALDGGLRLRAPPAVALAAQQRVGHIVAKYLQEVGDEAGSRATIVA